MLHGQRREKTILARTFENILFLAEVFSEAADREVPNVPILELARGCELSRPPVARVSRRQKKRWTLWE